MTARKAVMTFLVLAAMALAGCSDHGVTGSPGPAVSPDAPEIYDIPRLEGVAIDGREDDWGEQGLRVDLLLPGGPPTKAFEDHHARMRIGWTEAGVVVLVAVRDDVWVENPQKNEMWAGDAVELFLLAEPGARRRGCQWVISPGMAPNQPDPRWNLHDKRRDPNMPKGDTEPTLARTRVDGGYMLEVLLPFTCMEIRPELGRELGFHLWVDDIDEPNSRKPRRAGWVSREQAHRPVAYQRQAIRLAEEASPAVEAIVSAEYDFDRMCLPVDVVAARRYAGQAVTVHAGGRSEDVRLELDYTGHAIGQAKLPLGSPSQPMEKVTVMTAGRWLTGKRLGDYPEACAEQVVHLDIRGWPPAFAESRLPRVGFDRPLKARRLLGEYTLNTTYYDRDYTPVRRADRPGRYGAVVEVRSKHFPPFKRFATLFRAEGEPSYWHIQELKGHYDLPPELGIPPEAADIHSQAISRYFVDKAVWSMFDSSQTAVLLAGLYETQPGDEGGFYSNPFLTDRQWWVGLKRRLYGWDQQFRADVPAPRPLPPGREPAPVLREGTMSEAGMTPDAADRIHQVLSTWSADTDEAFAVCVARNGVIVLHRAYGTRAGEPMTVNTPSKIASVTKLLSSTLLMMFVDRDLLDLDEPLSTYLPPLASAPTDPPVTIRHCYTHTAGTKWHWGDSANDMSERMALVFPHYKVATRYSYNGTAMALACKAAEAVTGQSQPNLFRRCLWEPLGCETTWTADASGGGMTVPLELATLAQMLLNEGAYGDLEFFRPETFRQMLPRNLGYILGEDTKVVYGLGTSWYEGDGLGEGTFGHGSATSTTIRIDPQHRLVIVMNRNGGGKNFGTYHPKFIQAVTGCIAE